ncbi:hypothetical protein [Luedemannella helvata]|uniref:EcsC family protein n=1 Tax=Luedemannella helvata TaxID=349315 RepID=A0ABN2KZV9_9ACTN
MTNHEHVPDDQSGTALSGAGAGAPDPTDVITGAVVPAPRTGGTGGTAATPAADAVVDTVARLTADDLAPKERRRLLGQLAAALRERGFRDVFRPKAAMAWMSDLVADIAPRIPMRNAATLRAHYPNATDEQIADRLVRNATRATSAIGAVGGGVAAVEWAVPPALLTAPVLLSAETLAVVAVEIKLIGELQEIYGLPVAYTGRYRAVALVQAWASRRGVNLLVPGRGAAAVLGTAARHELRDRLLRRFGRNLTTLGPILTGAAVAAFLNRRATQRLAQEVRADLTKQRRAAIEGRVGER